MFIDYILEHVTFLKQMQRLGAKHVLEHFTDFNQWSFQTN